MKRARPSYEESHDDADEPGVQRTLSVFDIPEEIWKEEIVRWLSFVDAAPLRQTGRRFAAMLSKSVAPPWWSRDLVRQYPSLARVYPLRSAILVEWFADPLIKPMRCKFHVQDGEAVLRISSLDTCYDFDFPQLTTRLKRHFTEFTPILDVWVGGVGLFKTEKEKGVNLAEAVANFIFPMPRLFSASDQTKDLGVPGPGGFLFVMDSPEWMSGFHVESRSSGHVIIR